ncbi:MAG: VCBS repeat-containing protein [Planctomycetes bacterium]|nr:VCBS repeat-containing protein [Planctomycetota bacterium]
MPCFARRDAAAASMLFALALVPACGGGGGAGGGGPGPVQPQPRTAFPGFADGLMRPAAAFSLGRRPQGCVVADFDGDGVGDVFLVEADATYLENRAHYGIVVWGDRRGSYPTRTAVGGESEASSCVGGDLDGDGDIDIAVARTPTGPSTSAILRNEGGRMFAVETGGDWGTQQFAMREVQVFDADGDGDLDLIAGCVAPDYGARLFLNDGSGSFVNASSRLPAHFPPVERITIGDIDRDGALDVLVAGSVHCELWRNDGAGNFVDVSVALLPATARAAAVDAVLFDADGDLDADLVMARDGFVQLFSNLGAAGFVLRPWLGAGVSVAAADAEGDGDVDLAVVRLGAVGLLRNDGTGSFTDVTPGLVGLDSRFAERILAFEDLDHNGIADLVLAQGARSARVIRGITAERYAAEPEPVRPFDVFDVAAGDVDLDGDIDLVTRIAMTSTFATGQIRFNDGGGRFTLGPPFALPAQSRHLTVLDLDADGRQDLALESGWLRGTAAGFVSSVTAWANGRIATEDPIAIDVDGDGRTEVLLVGSFGLAVVDYVGQRLRERLLLTGAARAARRFDFDGDGAPDIVASVANRGLVLLRNDGSGGFFDASELLPAEPAAAWDVACADADGDGDTDLFAVAGVTVFRLRNDGPAGFVSERLAEFASGSIGKIVAGPFEGRGPADFVTVYRGFGHNAVIADLYVSYHDGVGGYLVDHHGLPDQWQALSDFVVADFEGDGDLDLAWASGSGSWNLGHVFFSSHRALRSSGVAQRGLDYGLTLQQAPGYATAESAATIAIGPVQPGVRIEGLGTWFVSDPFLVVPVVLPQPSGRVELRFPVPATVPAGVELAAQAEFLDGGGATAAFSNPVTDVVY